MFFLHNAFMYSIRGQRVSGQQIGRTIGFPTVNLEIDDAQGFEFGVYAGFVLHRGKKIPAWIHYGPRPTVGGDSPSFELFFLDFPEDLDDPVEVEVVEKIRDIQHFDSLEVLSVQIGLDIAYAKEHIFISS